MLRQDHRITLDAANGLGSLYIKDHCWDDANYYLRQAVDGYSRSSETIQPARDEKALKAMEGMAIALYNRKSFEAAEQMARGFFEMERTCMEGIIRILCRRRLIWRLSCSSRGRMRN